nr:hypothetical protein 14 [Paracoccaceae bacterium]
MKEIKTGLASDYQVAKHINSSRSQVRALVKKNPTFPKPLRITAGMTRWRWADVLEWEKTLTSE